MKKCRMIKEQMNLLEKLQSEGKENIRKIKHFSGNLSIAVTMATNQYLIFLSFYSINNAMTNVMVKGVKYPPTKVLLIAFPPFSPFTPLFFVQFHLFSSLNVNVLKSFHYLI